MVINISSCPQELFILPHPVKDLLTIHLHLHLFLEPRRISHVLVFFYFFKLSILKEFLTYIEVAKIVQRILVYFHSYSPNVNILYNHSTKIIKKKVTLV